MLQKSYKKLFLKSFVNADPGTYSTRDLFRVPNAPKDNTLILR